MYNFGGRGACSGAASIDRTRPVQRFLIALSLSIFAVIALPAAAVAQAPVGKIVAVTGNAVPSGMLTTTLNSGLLSNGSIFTATTLK